MDRRLDRQTRRQMGRHTGGWQVDRVAECADSANETIGGVLGQASNCLGLPNAEKVLMRMRDRAAERYQNPKP
jgi:hypothetical protein